MTTTSNFFPKDRLKSYMLKDSIKDAAISYKEIQALQNAANNTGAAGLEVKQKIIADKRYKTGAYFLTLNGTCISPVLDYENLNHFILGFSKAKSIYNN